MKSNIAKFYFFLAPSPYDCNFDQGTCTWTYDNTADFQWRRQTHGTGSLFTGPDHDHTTKDGTYVMQGGILEKGLGLGDF